MSEYGVTYGSLREAVIIGAWLTPRPSRKRPPDASCSVRWAALAVMRVAGLDLGDAGGDAQCRGGVEHVRRRHECVPPRRLRAPDARPAQRLELDDDLADAARGVLVEQRGPQSDASDVDHGEILAQVSNRTTGSLASMTTLAAGLLAVEGDSGNFVEIDVELWHWAVLLGGDPRRCCCSTCSSCTASPRCCRPSVRRSSRRRGSRCGLGFTFVIWAWFGVPAAGEYISGYLIEESLSVDNVFVWALIMSYFLVPPKYQHRVLFWGIFGALILRATFIFAGVAIIQRFDWVLYIFGAFLLYTAGRLVFGDNDHVDPGKSKFLKFANTCRAEHRSSRRPEAVHASRTGAGWRRRCSRCCCWSRPPTWCSPSTACRPCSPSATSSSSCSRRTRSRSWGCERCTS